MRILTETITSPTLINQIQTLLQAFPQARWDQYNPVNRDNVRDGARMAFGQDVDTHYRFDQATVVVSLDADFLGAMPGYVRYARDFSNQRRVRANKKQMNRLYVIESTTTITGTMADHRLPLRRARAELLTRGAASEAELEAVVAEVKATVAGWAKFAQESPAPDAATALDYVYADPEVLAV